MNDQPAPNSVTLSHAIRHMFAHPLALLRDWNWKAALFSAIIRSLIFFFTNLRGGRHQAAQAMLTELVYATVAAGLAGAITQRLRHATPRRLTAVVVMVGIPVFMLTLQALAHRIMGTQHVKTGLIASFLFASIATAFNWFAMSKGAFVTGEQRSFLRDLAIVPKLIAQFVTVPFRALRS